MTDQITPTIIPFANGTVPKNTTTAAIQFFYSHEVCHLWQYFNYGYQGYVRLVSEIVVFVCIIVQLVLIGLDIYHIGRRRWWTVLVGFLTNAKLSAFLEIISC